jgi:hypothetical protein
MSDDIDFMEQPVAALTSSVPPVTDDQIDHIEALGGGKFLVFLLVAQDEIQEFTIRAFTDQDGEDHVSISATDNEEMELLQFTLMTIVVSRNEEPLAKLVRYFTATPDTKPI